jgi:hypothetical protein
MKINNDEINYEISGSKNSVKDANKDRHGEENFFQLTNLR